MEIYDTISKLKEALQAAKQDNKSIGLVPTMGALHMGHASLVKRSYNDNDISIVSIFVNPTQFNDQSDLDRYPRTLEADCALLNNIGKSYNENSNKQSTTNKQIIVFAPSISEMYPEEDKRIFSYPPTDAVMEGIYRKGHFNGVCQIVSKLFEIVMPHKAYFGQKDFQQIAVIRRMNEDKGYNINIVECEIIREQSGLALSSRNALLSDNEKAIATNIIKALRASKGLIHNHSIEQTRRYVIDTINAIDGLDVQYYEIVDGYSLSSISNWSDSQYIVGCITCFCGSIPVRLIDNIIYKEPC